MTVARRAVVGVLSRMPNPLSILDLLGHLKKEGLQPNKTTVYREISFLTAQGIVQEVQFTENTKRYEIVAHHHHHIVCTACKKIEDVVLEGDVAAHEKKIARDRKYRDITHALEFYGICASCQ